MMLTLQDYWMGRDARYPLDMTPQIDANARLTVDLVKKLLGQSGLHGIVPATNPITGTIVSSGWRPPYVNAGTNGAAPNSRHMTGQAVDIYDPDGDLDEWLMTQFGRAALEAIGLWVEHPACTKSWCHLQTVPPKSGNRFFYP